MNFVEELRWRGMIHDMMPGTEEQLQKEMTSAYVGIDPTADSLHIGHLVSVMMLKHLQRAGHRPIALVGGATGMIGDPSMKSAERNLLDEATLRHNQESIKKQLSKFLDFDSDAPNAAKLVNNYDWMIVYSIVAIFLFASNYQFVLRTPNFIQIALSVPLLFLLYRFRNPVNKNLKPYTYILLSAESVIHFAYLLLYVYNNAQFVF